MCSKVIWHYFHKENALAQNASVILDAVNGQISDLESRRTATVSEPSHIAREMPGFYTDSFWQQQTSPKDLLQLRLAPENSNPLKRNSSTLVWEMDSSEGGKLKKKRRQEDGSQKPGKKGRGKVQELPSEIQMHLAFLLDIIGNEAQASSMCLE